MDLYKKTTLDFHLGRKVIYFFHRVVSQTKGLIIPITSAFSKGGRDAKKLLILWEQEGKRIECIYIYDQISKFCNRIVVINYPTKDFRC